MQNPDKLVSKVFKARYYPRGSFLNAEIGYNPSYIWRSVIGAQSLLKQGMGCRVGNGSSINIIQDPWLPLEHEAYVQTDSPALQNQMVSSLMDDQGNWDFDLIMDVFDSRDADAILSIPLNNETEDKWHWRREKLGTYTVKSAYAMLQELKDGQGTAPSSGLWRNLWNLKIPPKVKHFLWQACTNCLPTKDNLQSKRVQVNNICPVCNNCSESVLHTLVNCSYAVACWSRVSYVSLDGVYSSFFEWFQLMLDQQHRTK